MTQAAFFRFESTLVRRTASGCAAFLAVRQADMLSRFSRLVALGASAPLGGLLGPFDAHRPTRLLWRPLKGCSEDRLAVLCEDWWNDELDRAWNDAGLKLLARCKDAGMRTILVSDQPLQAIEPAQRHLGIDEVICNRLEVVNGEVTGHLTEPVFTGRVDGSFLRTWAMRNDLDPAFTLAYGSSAEDATLLSGAGRPCAVTPDRTLRRLAHEFDWPVVESA